MGYFKMMTAIPVFFLSSYFLMLLWGVIAPEFGIATISYVKAMLITFTIWLVVVPVFAVARSKYHFHYKA